MDLFTRIERMYHAAVDLELCVAHLVSALQSLHAGRFEDAHWSLARGGFATEPAECDLEGGLK